MMYNPEVSVIQEEFIVTTTGNIISRDALICKPQTVEIPNGRVFVSPQAIIRGDLAPIQLNKYCYVGDRSVVHPPYAMMKQQFKFIPTTIGSHTYIGKDCVIEAAVIGIGCHISDNCILSKRCILKDFVLVLEGAVVSSDMVIPPFSIVAGNPAQIVGEQSESVSTTALQEAVTRFKSIKTVKRSSLL